MAARHEVVLVLTQPDRPTGRGLRAAASPVKRLAQQHGLEVFQPQSLREPSHIERVRAARPEVLVVAAYGLILPPELLQLGRHGALNIHASLLPRWRGAAPIQRALLAGDPQTGISIMQMEAGLDTGPVLKQAPIAITAQDDAGTLEARLAELGAGLVLDVLAEAAKGPLRATPQPQQGVTYARKIEKREARLDWTRPAQELERAVRAFRPSPGAWSTVDGEPLKIWGARLAEDALPPGVGSVGEVLKVGCGQGALELTELQRAGGKRLPAREFLRGHRIRDGARFE